MWPPRVTKRGPEPGWFGICGKSLQTRDEAKETSSNPPWKSLERCAACTWTEFGDKAIWRYELLCSKSSMLPTKLSFLCPCLVLWPHPFWAKWLRRCESSPGMETSKGTQLTRENHSGDSYSWRRQRSHSNTKHSSFSTRVQGSLTGSRAWTSFLRLFS